MAKPGEFWKQPEPGTQRAEPQSFWGKLRAQWILLCVIALLMVSLIGFPVAVALLTRRLNEANGCATTCTTPTATATFDDACSTNSSETAYTVPFGNRDTFVLFCNKDLGPSDIYAVTTPTFKTCMDACSNYRGSYATGNLTCAGVSFVPAWVNRTKAAETGSIGSCFLKHGPFSEANLTKPRDGLGPMHSALFTA